MITGGTGSFGNAFVKRLLQTDVKEIRIFSRDEKKQDDMRKRYSDSRIKYYIGDVRDRQTIDNAMNGVDFIFHASALKQVPTCENFPMEAVKTNVIGTENVLDSAIKHGVKKVIVLSTDKASYPINAMGMSKAMMEKIAVAKSRRLTENDTIICRTRYGNVLASRGSVVPLFAQQAREGNQITVTDGDMTRFLMTLDEAVDLVIYAFENGKQGDLFVKKSPSATVSVIAQAVKELTGSHSEIVTVGARYGEKAHETLVTVEEMANAEDKGSYFKITEKEDRTVKGMNEISEYNSFNTQRLTLEETKKLLCKLDLF